MNQKTLLVVLVVLINFSDCARILCVVPTPSYSHQIAFRPFTKELSLRGHQVVAITTDPINDPKLVNLTEISIRSAYDVWNEYIEAMTTATWFDSLLAIRNSLFAVNRHILGHPEVQKLLKNETEHFDLVLMEIYQSAMFVFAERFKAPLILSFPMNGDYYVHSMIGNPLDSLTYPNCLAQVHYDMPLSERVGVALLNAAMKFFVPYVLNMQAVIVKEYFGTNQTFVYHLQPNVSLMLTNSDHIFYKVKPLLPTIIEYGGGTHRFPPKPLPKELQKTLDSAKQGVIYFSLGSNVRSTFLSNETRSSIIKTFAELPYLVLWKYEDENLPNKPKNVITSKWFPQQDILRHPNIKLFITQGGLQSMEEAIYDYVPMVIIPFFGDQHSNAYRMVAKGCAVSLDYRTLTKEDLRKNILEVINNPRYKNRIQQLAELVQDQPMTGLEKAIWWIEYVIRHNGTEHLRSPFLDMPFYQYYHLDVIAVFATVIFIVISIFVVIVIVTRKLLSKAFSKNTKSKTA